RLRRVTTGLRPGLLAPSALRAAFGGETAGLRPGPRLRLGLLAGFAAGCPALPGCSDFTCSRVRGSGE
ncbi:hypothetical protein, partial [Kitasatospora griseola]|uniref:hypothetical protein n=1 Tax=Kitasatospora griseola TaxID=2064 RepID=UPI00382CFFDA